MFKHGGDMQIHKTSTHLNNDQSHLANIKSVINLTKMKTTRDRCAHLAQLFRVLMQLFQDGQSLLLGAVLQNPLDNSAAIRVCGQHKHLHT